MTNFYIADTHWGHKNCMAFDNRPFPDIETHDADLIENWNNVVGLQDDVYILGDVSWKNVTQTIEILNRLNGNKHLIVGNHDGKHLRNKNYRDCFVEIEHYKELVNDDGTGIVLQHYPCPCYNKRQHGWYMLYGHIHSNYEVAVMEEARRTLYELRPDMPCNMFNVGAMMPYMNYTPRTLTEILNACDVQVSVKKI